MIPYSRQHIDQEDIDAVIETLRSDWLTTGPCIESFEHGLAGFVGVSYATAVSSGTAALHCALSAIGIGSGDEVIVPAITFAATANAVLYLEARPVFADIDPQTLLVDPESVRDLITPKTRAVIAVDYAGQPCDYQALRQVTNANGLILVADGCHALGAADEERNVGQLADLTVFSFHPVKSITSGEGGMVVSDKIKWIDRIKTFRNHGITSDFRQRERRGTWTYDMAYLGFNYRMTDFQAALGLSQLHKLPKYISARQNIAEIYDRGLSGNQWLSPLHKRNGIRHAYHLYVVKGHSEFEAYHRKNLFDFLRSNGIGVNVHYQPVYFHSYYRLRFGIGPGLCPNAEAAYDRIISLPVFVGLQKEQVALILEAVETGLDQLS